MRYFFCDLRLRDVDFLCFRDFLFVLFRFLFFPPTCLDNCGISLEGVNEATLFDASLIALTPIFEAFDIKFVTVVYISRLSFTTLANLSDVSPKTLLNESAILVTERINVKNVSLVNFEPVPTAIINSHIGIIGGNAHTPSNTPRPTPNAAVLVFVFSH